MRNVAASFWRHWTSCCLLYSVFFVTKDPELGIPFNDCFKNPTYLGLHSLWTLYNSLGGFVTVSLFCGRKFQSSIFSTLSIHTLWLHGTLKTISEKCTLFLLSRFRSRFSSPHTLNGTLRQWVSQSFFRLSRSGKYAFSNNQLLQRLRFLCNHFFLCSLTTEGEGKFFFRELNRLTRVNIYVAYNYPKCSHTLLSGALAFSKTYPRH